MAAAVAKAEDGRSHAERYFASIDPNAYKSFFLLVAARSHSHTAGQSYLELSDSRDR